ncbi:MAG: dephospho-CoA kinase [Bacteroidetes bacterium]|nr:dephospho-CoA kinase [Bacteroidota bacterium]
MSHVRTLGVTGGIGSGKSTVCQFLKDFGAMIFDADQQARDLMEANQQVKHEVKNLFGPLSYYSDGSLNRRWLASQVFDNETNLLNLNAIIHPRVRQNFIDLKNHLPSGLLVHEAALIFEAQLDHELDAVCVISAPTPLRIQRAMTRDGLTEDDVRARMSYQLPQHEIQRRADIVLINAGDKNQLMGKVSKLYNLAISTDQLSPLNFKFHRQL